MAEVKTRVFLEYGGKQYDFDKLAEQAKKDYDAVSDELARAQTALDVLNNSVKFEIDLQGVFLPHWRANPFLDLRGSNPLVHG